MRFECFGFMAGIGSSFEYYAPSARAIWMKFAHYRILIRLQAENNVVPTDLEELVSEGSEKSVLRINNPFCCPPAQFRALPRLHVISIKSAAQLGPAIRRNCIDWACVWRAIWLVFENKKQKNKTKRWECHRQHLTEFVETVGVGGVGRSLRSWSQM